VSNSGDYAVHMVDNLLDILTDCEHSKTHAILLQVGYTSSFELEISLSFSVMMNQLLFPDVCIYM